jgi:hypothetical protein
MTKESAADIYRLDRLREILLSHIAQRFGDHLKAPFASVGGGGVAVQGNNFEVVFSF